MKKHVHEEGDNKQSNKKEERTFEKKEHNQIYACKKIK